MVYEFSKFQGLTFQALEGLASFNLAVALVARATNDRQRKHLGKFSTAQQVARCLGHLTVDCWIMLRCDSVAEIAQLIQIIDASGGNEIVTS